ncbi:MAG: threonine synthase, partial [Clostridia bacterium]|nr:threonine synthase [Clostridia bacterium]
MSVFFSSRDTNGAVDSKTAILNGLAPDGGLYIPEKIPRLSYRDLMGLTYSEAAARIISAWFDDMSNEDISSCCKKAYSSFDTAAVAPVVKAGSIFIVELFHGETCAFKDVALSLLPRLMTVARNASNAKQDTLILTATSGDTGSAAMNGFRDVDHTGIIVFYPYEGVSPLQRKQMVCMPGKNVKACAVLGNFDDCQSAIKQAFAELPSDDQLKYSSANSINIARLVPQIVYYFTTYLYLLQKGELKDGEPLSFIVPTGNFGDILAGYYAKKMGLPVGKLVCASKANRVLTDFIQTGLYDRRRKFVRTSSPSMDILISSNLERLLSDVTDVDDNIVREWMRLLNTQGYYQMSGEPLKR